MTIFRSDLGGDETPMQWFKHMADMSEDTKVKRLIRRYGADGYALYVYIIERIVKNLDSDDPLPELEEQSVDIAHDFGIDTARVEEIMWYCIEQGLFEQDEVTGRIVSHKVYKFIDKAMTSNAQIREMIERYKEQHQQSSATISERQDTVSNHQPRLEETRREEKRGEGETHGSKAADSRHHITQKPMKRATYEQLIEQYGQATVDDYFERVNDYCQSKGRQYRDHAATVRNWLKRDGVERRERSDTGPMLDTSGLPSGGSNGA